MKGMAATTQKMALKYGISVGQLVVGQQQLASTRGDDGEEFGRDQFVQTRGGLLCDDEVAAAGLEPHGLPLLIVDKHIRRARRIGTINQVIEPAVEQQSVSIRVKKNRRERVVVMVHDEFSGGCAPQSFGKRPGG